MVVSATGARDPTAGVLFACGVTAAAAGVAGALLSGAAAGGTTAGSPLSARGPAVMGRAGTREPDRKSIGVTTIERGEQQRQKGAFIHASE